MTESASTGVAESELEAPSPQNSTGVVRSIGEKSHEVEVMEGPEDQSYVYGPGSVWPRESSREALRPPVHRLKADSAPRSISLPASFAPFSARPVRIAIKTKRKILLINPSDVLAVEAKGNYVLLRRRADSCSLREPISSLTEKLKAYGFVRIHRSILVNSSWVEEIHPGPTGEYTLRLAGGKEYTVSRTYKANLKSLAQSWIGTDSFADE